MASLASFLLPVPCEPVLCLEAYSVAPDSTFSYSPHRIYSTRGPWKEAASQDDICDLIMTNGKALPAPVLVLSSRPESSVPVDQGR